MAVITIPNIFAAGNKIVAAEVNSNFSTFKTFIEANCVQTDGTVKATTSSLNDLCVTTAKLNDLSVSSGKIADLAVITSKINDSAVTTAKLNDLAVTNDKIANATITGGKFASSLSPVYLSATTTGLPTTDGTVAYINSGDANEGIQTYNGSAWRRPWNMPWGVIANVSVTTNQGSITSQVDVTGLTNTSTYVANRLLKITVQTSKVISTVANDRIDFFVLLGANTIGNFVTGPVTASIGISACGVYYVTSISGSQTIKVQIARGVGTGTVSTSASSVSPFQLIIEDIGPSGAPA